MSLALLAAHQTFGGSLFDPFQPTGPASFERLRVADYRIPWLALADSPLNSFSQAYTSVSVREPQQVTTARSDGKETADVSAFTEKRIYTSGEVGFLYGHSAGGRHSFDTEQGYIFGSAGNDNIQISVGASYQEWNARGLRHR